jgi:CheY-like chemotaxis protein
LTLVASDSHRRQVLVVEDDPAIRELPQLHLALAGFDVAEVDDGPAALELARAKRFDLLVLDVMLPQPRQVEQIFDDSIEAKRFACDRPQVPLRLTYSSPARPEPVEGRAVLFVVRQACPERSSSTGSDRASKGSPRAESPNVFGRTRPASPRPCVPC